MGQAIPPAKSASGLSSHLRVLGKLLKLEKLSDIGGSMIFSTPEKKASSYVPSNNPTSGFRLMVFRRWCMMVGSRSHFRFLLGFFAILFFHPGQVPGGDFVS